MHPFGDPGLRDDFAQVATAIDLRDEHRYTVEWMPGAARFYLDDKRLLYVRGGGDPFLISEELASLATWLASEENAFSTGIGSPST